MSHSEENKADGKNGRIILLPIIFLTIAVIALGYIANQDDQKISKLESELNKTNIITSGLINFTSNQINFNNEVSNWSNQVNNNLHILDNRTSSHK